MNRREFLLSSSAVTLAAAGRVRAQGAASKLDRVAIMTYSFDRIVRIPGRPDDPARTLDLFDIPEMYADRYKVHNIEVQHNHFASTESSFFKEFMTRVARAKSRVTNINLEFGNMSITAADPVMRAQAVDLTRQWIDHAVELRSPRVMINQGSPAPENLQVGTQTLKLMGDYGKSKKIMVSMEPRGGGGGGAARGARAGAATEAPPVVPAPAPPPAYALLVDLIKGSGTYANVDIGNFGGDQATQHAGIRAMMPYTVGNTHIKIRPASYDLGAALALLRELKYTGLYSIEAGGGGDPHMAVQVIYDALLAAM